MRFIQLNFRTGDVLIFNHDRIREISGKNDEIQITLHGDEHNPIDFIFDIIEFSNLAFSPDDTELEGDSDIQIVRIDENPELDLESEILGETL